tara:strand:+ start:559 stop:705 length:147 start_codon:yes stop_codon:yes gene_type:complete
MKKFKKPSGVIVEVNPNSESLAIAMGWTPVEADQKKEAPKADKPTKSK